MTTDDRHGRPVRPAMAKTLYEGEVFSHRVLWVTAKKMRDQAEVERRGSMYFDMAAMLLARLTVEAYCNFLLHVLYPATFAVERETFRSDIDAKVQWLSREIGYTLDLGRRPYQTVKALTTFRDRIVHAKPEVYAGEHIHPLDVDPPFMEPGELEGSVSFESRARALEDVSQLCEAMHQKALAMADHKQEMRLHPFALEGVTQIQSGSTGLAPVLAAIIASALAYGAGEPLPELSEAPAVVFQTSTLVGSLTYSWSLALSDDLRVRFD